jgi:hypothetical protein
MLMKRLMCCKPVVQQTSHLDAETYLQLLIAKTTQPNACNSSIHSGSAPTTDSNSKSTCIKQLNYVMDLALDYETYYKTKYLNNNHIPLSIDKLHYPPMISRNRNGCGGSMNNFTYEEFKNMNKCS